MDVLHTVWGVSYNTMVDRVWQIIQYLTEHLPDFPFESRYHTCLRFTDEQYISMIVDATETFIQRPDPQKQREFYSGYKKRHTLKYTIGIDVKGQQIVFLDGPYKGPEHDMTMIYKSNVLARLPEGEVIMGDKKYIKHHKVVTEYDCPFNLLQSFIERRVLVEQIIGRLKKFQCISGTWRHSLDRHSVTFRAVAKLVNFTLLHT